MREGTTQRSPSVAPLRLGIIAALAAVVVAVSLLPGHLSSHAVQDPSISLDMDTAGNSYSDPGAAGDNSMTVGTIDNCLTAAAPGNDFQHNHLVHLIVQNVEDLVAWQARFNYNGGQMRPSAFNPTPFTDSATTAQVGFLNLPIDPTLGDHRGVTPSQAIPPAAPGPQTALIGLNRFGANTAPISPDTPYINDEPTQSYDAPTGGILAAVTLQVLAGNAGNASLFMNMDDGNPNPPETNVTVFTSTGSQTLPIPVGQLGDSYHGEGATCVPLDCATPECPLVLTTPTETPTPTATPAPPTPTPATTPTVTPPPSPGPGGTFNPELSATYSETTPGSHPDITSTFTIGLGPDGQPGTDDDTGDYHFAGIVNFSPSSPQDSDIPDGAIIGTRQSMETIGVVNNPCVVLIPLEFTYMEATTDINDTVEPFPYGFSNDLGPIAGDAPPFDGVADVKPPPAVTKYPSYLNAIFDPDWVDYGADRIAGNADDTNGPQPPLKPRFRSVGIKSLPFAVGHWLIRQEVVFEPGTKLPNLPAFDPSLGYPTVIVHQMASAAGSATPPAIGLITDFSLAFSQRDADGDGYENTIDTCPFHTDTVWNPHSPRLPGSGIPGDRDIFVGVPFGDGISDICDPTPTELTHAPGGQPTDHDGDGFPNSGDNCPTTYNPDQTDNDLTVAGERAGDGIGDACDTPGTDGGMDCVSEGCAGSTPRPIPARSVSGQGPDVPDGEQIICARTLVVTIGGDPSAAVSDCLAGLPGAGTPFNPQSTVTFASTAPGASSDITLSFGLEAPDLLFTDVVSFSPTQLAVASGAEVADGAEVGTLGSQATLGLLNSSCTLPTNVDFTLFDATTNTRNAISASFDFLAGDINSDGVADIRPPPVVTQYPSFLNTLFGGVTPRARYAAATRIPSASFWVILQIAVFDPGTVLPGIAFDPTLGYPSVTVLLDPTSPPGPSAITDFCSPLTTSATIFGLTRDNVDTPLNEGGITLRTNPPAAGPVDFTVFAASRRDADGDGIENTLDPCPLHADAKWDPRAIAPRQRSLPAANPQTMTATASPIAGTTVRWYITPVRKTMTRLRACRAPMASATPAIRLEPTRASISPDARSRLAASPARARRCRTALACCAQGRSQCRSAVQTMGRQADVSRHCPVASRHPAPNRQTTMQTVLRWSWGCHSRTGPTHPARPLLPMTRTASAGATPFGTRLLPIRTRAWKATHSGAVTTRHCPCAQARPAPQRSHVTIRLEGRISPASGSTPWPARHTSSWFRPSSGDPVATWYSPSS